MKCPKCGYNSFEYYDSCKKCSSDLTGYKQTYSITSIVLPQAIKEERAAGFRSAESAVDQVSESADTHDDIFSFDLPDDSPAPVQGNNDPFNFNSPSPDVNQTGASKPEDDAFADLLESTSQSDESAFAAAQTAAPTAAAKSTDSSSVAGEFDLENFSWDDAPSTTSVTDRKEAADDFDSLFGDAKDKTQK